MKLQLIWILTGASMLAAVAPVHAIASDDSRECLASHFNVNDLTSYAETKEQRLASSSVNNIDPGVNGSVRVHGWNNADVQVKACVMTAAATEQEARNLASQISIVQGPGNIEARGPSNDEHQHWSVSYEVWVPTESNLSLKAHNGSLGVDDVHGQIRFETLNGSVRLNAVNGDVEGTTTNGSVAVDVANGTWNGAGMHVKTTNGSVRLRLPENVSAHVEASTVNGSVHTDFPATIPAGSSESRRHITLDLGGGGPTIEATTVNGSVHITRS